MSLLRSASEPIRTELNWHDRWKGPDNGLIYCWERGRQLRSENPELAERADKGELVMLWWKGGVEQKIKGEKNGTFFYLATWQGLRGEDLDIDPTGECVLECSRTRQTVTYSSTGFEQD